MTGILTLRFNTQAQSDIQRITRELSDLQRQVASGSKSNDLQGYGEGAARLINAQGVRSVTDARGSMLQQVEARFGVQASALSQVSNAAGDLAQNIIDGVTSNDGRGIGTELNLAFSFVVSGLNETWNGQPLFAGERVGSGPLKISTLEELLGATTPDQLFDEAERPQTLDFGPGDPVKLAPKASEISQPLLDAFRDLKTLIDQAGGEFPAPLTDAQKTQLQGIATRLIHEKDTFTNAEGRAGQLEQRFSSERARLQDRSNLLLKEIGDQADADLAQVSVRINSLLAQYQAAAKTFSDLSNLSLLPYLTK